MTQEKLSKQHPNIQRIWVSLYRVLIPAGLIRSVESQQHRPELLSGDKNIDQMQMKALTPVYVTINDMVEYFREGINVRLTDDKDAVKIFDALMDHVGCWKDAMVKMLNIGDTPVDDLILMEEFAISIYDIAKFRIYEDKRGQLIQRMNKGFRHFGGLQRTTVGSGTRAAPVMKPRTNKDIDDMRYEPNLDILHRVAVEQSVDYGSRGY